MCAHAHTGIVGETEECGNRRGQIKPYISSFSTFVNTEMYVHPLDPTACMHFKILLFLNVIAPNTDGVCVCLNSWDVGLITKFILGECCESIVGVHTWRALCAPLSDNSHSLQFCSAYVSAKLWPQGHSRTEGTVHLNRGNFALKQYCHEECPIQTLDETHNFVLEPFVLKFYGTLFLTDKIRSSSGIRMVKASCLDWHLTLLVNWFTIPHFCFLCMMSWILWERQTNFSPNMNVFFLRKLLRTCSSSHYNMDTEESPAQH